MSVGLSIDLTDNVSWLLAQAVEGLDDRTLLHEKISLDELSLVQDHLTEISIERHLTADRLGASRSGFWENAAGQTTANADAQQATISIRHPGIGRADHDVTIVPGPGKQYLPLPLLAAAYNQRAAGLDDLFVIRSHEGALFLARHVDQDKESGLEVLYLLVKSVTLPKDDTLLPQPGEFLGVALRAVSECVDAIMAGQQGGLN